MKVFVCQRNKPHPCAIGVLRSNPLRLLKPRMANGAFSCKWHQFGSDCLINTEIAHPRFSRVVMPRSPSCSNNNKSNRRMTRNPDFSHSGESGTAPTLRFRCANIALSVAPSMSRRNLLMGTSTPTQNIWVGVFFPCQFARIGLTRYPFRCQNDIWHSAHISLSFE